MASSPDPHPQHYLDAAAQAYQLIEPIAIDDDDLMFGGKSLSAWYEEERRRARRHSEEERRGRQRHRTCQSHQSKTQGSKK